MDAQAHAVDLDGSGRRQADSVSCHGSANIRAARAPANGGRDQRAARGYRPGTVLRARSRRKLWCSPRSAEMRFHQRIASGEAPRLQPRRAPGARQETILFVCGCCRLTQRCGHKSSRWTITPAPVEPEPAGRRRRHGPAAVTDVRRSAGAHPLRRHSFTASRLGVMTRVRTGWCSARCLFRFLTVRRCAAPRASSPALSPLREAAICLTILASRRGHGEVGSGRASTAPACSRW